MCKLNDCYTYLNFIFLSVDCRSPAGDLPGGGGPGWSGEWQSADPGVPHRGGAGTRAQLVPRRCAATPHRHGQLPPGNSYNNLNQKANSRLPNNRTKLITIF